MKLFHIWWAWCWKGPVLFLAHLCPHFWAFWPLLLSRALPWNGSKIMWDIWCEIGVLEPSFFDWKRGKTLAKSFRISKLHTCGLLTKCNSLLVSLVLLAWDQTYSRSGRVPITYSNYIQYCVESNPCQLCLWNGVWWQTGLLCSRGNSWGDYWGCASLNWKKKYTCRQSAHDHI